MKKMVAYLASAAIMAAALAAFAVPCTAFAASEKELIEVDYLNDDVNNNDTINKASKIAFDNKVFGTFKKSGEKDYFVVDAPASGMMTIDFKSEYGTDKYSSANIYVLDQYHDEIKWDREYNKGYSFWGNSVYVSCQTLRPQPVCFKVNKGTNYILISANSYNEFDKGHPYSFSLGYFVDAPILVASKTKAGAKAIKVGWLPTKEATGYQVRYATSKSGLKAAKVYTTTSKTKTFTKLKAKKKYYAQVRTVFIAGGVTYYSDWTTTKALKTK